MNWSQTNDGSGSGLDADLIGSPGQMLVFNGTTWEFAENYPTSISLQTMMDLTDPNIQEGIVHILKSSFTDPKMIEKFIRDLSPTEELRQLRNTIWQMLR